ncbi:hypothetical protein GQ55_5G141100 [Panicum hallii var. hallii]|uniref:Uncharacterized protein n=1 Tax=Panicum hallii var. hallii TaxID=1504633 RepID=A0A2T7DG53_9POAL|nr:hypothetical protein GQ55_5G141100 [Panicum hallii var. hallii]
MDIISLVLSIWMISLLAFEILAKCQIESKSLGLWAFTRRVGADDLAAALLSPSPSTLQMPHFARARRFSFWFLALLFHTVNALLYAIKLEADQWCLWMKNSGSVMTLVICIGLLVLLRWRFPITKDFWIACGTFGTFYVPTAVVAMFVISSSQSAIVLGLIHIFITVLMHILRFSCQTAAFIGLLFRFFDVIFILGGGRDKINHVLVRLHEFLA